jgi:hypothetical protein
VAHRLVLEQVFTPGESCGQASLGNCGLKKCTGGLQHLTSAKKGKKGLLKVSLVHPHTMLREPARCRRPTWVAYIYH